MIVFRHDYVRTGVDWTKAGFGEGLVNASCQFAVDNLTRFVMVLGAENRFAFTLQKNPELVPIVDALGPGDSFVQAVVRLFPAMDAANGRETMRTEEWQRSEAADTNTRVRVRRKNDTHDLHHARRP